MRAAVSRWAVARAALLTAETVGDTRIPVSPGREVRMRRRAARWWRLAGWLTRSR